MRSTSLGSSSLLALFAFTVGCATLGDKDKDGIKRRDDACPELAEDLDGFEDHDGCPEDGGSNVQPHGPAASASREPALRFGGGDRDGDGVSEKNDACASEPEDFDAFEDEDGCPDVDNDRDGNLDVDDKCPNVPEDKDGFADGDGCPDGDNDNDGLSDATDRCPNEAGTNGGCP